MNKHQLSLVAGMCLLGGLGLSNAIALQDEDKDFKPPEHEVKKLESGKRNEPEPPANAFIFTLPEEEATENAAGRYCRQVNDCYSEVIITNPYPGTRNVALSCNSNVQLDGGWAWLELSGNGRRLNTSPLYRGRGYITMSTSWWGSVDRGRHIASCRQHNQGATCKGTVLCVRG